MSINPNRLGVVAPIDPRRMRRLGAAHTVRKMFREHGQNPFRNSPTQIGGTIQRGESVDTDITKFTNLTDTPPNYVGQSLLFVRVNVGETGLEFAAAGGSSYIGLSDTGVGYGTNLQVPKTDGVGAIAWGWVDWFELSSVPATFPPSAHTHSIYTHIDGSTPFTGTVGGITPVAGTDLATKDYVDGEITPTPAYLIHATVSVPSPTMTLTASRNIIVPIDSSLNNVDLSVPTMAGNPGGFVFIFKRVTSSTNTVGISFIDGIDGTVNAVLYVMNETLVVLWTGGSFMRIS